MKLFSLLTLFALSPLWVLIALWLWEVTVKLRRRHRQHRSRRALNRILLQSARPITGVRGQTLTLRRIL